LPRELAVEARASTLEELLTMAWREKELVPALSPEPLGYKAKDAIRAQIAAELAKRIDEK
jgi:hypothetical protein